MAQEKQKVTFKELSIQNPKSGQGADLTTGIIEFSYYESILSNHVTANLIVGDTGNTVGEGKNKKDLLNGLPVRGGEPVRVRVLDQDNNELRFVGTEGAFYVNRVKDAIQENQKSIVSLDLCTKEFIANEQSRVQKRYSGKISESVKKILKDVMKTNKPQEIEETSNFI
jgi:hypothetical protein